LKEFELVVVQGLGFRALTMHPISVFFCFQFFYVAQLASFYVNLATPNFFGVDQVAMLIHESLETGYKVEFIVVKSKPTILNLRYAKQQLSRVQSRNMVINWNSM
jgi:hypothetical protein